MTCTCSLLCRFHITGTSTRRQRSSERTGSHFLAPAGILEKTMKAFTVAATALAVLPRMAWAHHFMDGGLPETFAQGLLSGLGHPVIGLDHAAFIVGAEAAPLAAYLIGFSLVQLGIAAAALLLHRRLIAAREAWARLASSGIGAAVGTIGAVFLVINIAAQP